MDTGLLYRAVALNLWRWGGDPASEFEALRACDMLNIDPDDQELAKRAGVAIASSISAYPSVRTALRERQEEFAAQAGRRRARRPRHRHRDRAGSRREAVRHCLAGSPRRTPHQASSSARNAGAFRRRARRHPGPRRTRQRARSGAARAAADALRARHQRSSMRRPQSPRRSVLPRSALATLRNCQRSSGIIHLCSAICRSWAQVNGTRLCAGEQARLFA